MSSRKKGWSKNLKSSEPEKQLAVLGQLNGIEDTDFAVDVARLLSSQNGAVRTAAVDALAKIWSGSSEDYYRSVIHNLADPDDGVRCTVVDSLASGGCKESISDICHLLFNDPSPVVRATAAEALGELGGVGNVADLQVGLKDPEPVVRAYSALALGLVAGPEILPLLAQHIQNEENPQVSVELLGAAYRLGDDTALRSLLVELRRVDLESSAAILNLFDDLATRRRPPTLGDNSEQIIELLRQLAENWPLLTNEIQIIVHKLSSFRARHHSV